MSEDTGDEEVEVAEGGEELMVPPVDRILQAGGYIHVSFQHLHRVESLCHCHRLRFRLLSTSIHLVVLSVVSRARMRSSLAILSSIVYFHERTKLPYASHTAS